METIVQQILPWFYAILTALIVTGCAAVGPNYTRPAVSVPDGWHTRLQQGLNTNRPQRLARWWTVFNDPVLSGLIKQALADNLDLKKARAVLRQARANRTMSRSGLYPTLNTSGSATKSRSNTIETNLYNAGFDASWELDIFGGVRRSVEAATADLQADRENLRDILVSLLAEVAQNYIDVRTDQTRLIVAAENIKIQQKNLQLAKTRHKNGLVTDLDVQQATYSLENSRAKIPSLRTGLENAMNSIALLLGRPPGAVHDQLQKKGLIPIVPVQVAVGVPADLVRRRPDIRRAERLLAAQAARVGVATAALYPRLKLSGSIDFAAVSLDNLFDAASRTSRIGPGINWPIFDAGKIRANIKMQSAIQDQDLIQYESTVLTALNEVENALTAYANERKREQSLRRSALAAKNTVKLAKIRYRTGLTDFTTVLNAERSLLSVQDELAQSRSTVTADLVKIYKALGGGWTSMASTASISTRYQIPARKIPARHIRIHKGLTQ